MPAAVAAAASAAANFISGAVYSGLTAIGVSAGTAALVSTYAASITALAVSTIAYVGPSILFAPRIPSPEFARTVKRQPIPDRVSGYGRVLLGGATMLYEPASTSPAHAMNVYAMHDGLIDGWEEVYLNDMEVTVGGDGYVESGPDLRYGKFGDLVEIDSRRGLPTETVYARIASLGPDVWPSNARGDGIASLMMIAKSGDQKLYTRDYPNGLPVPRRVGRLQYCWDPRLGARGTITNDSDKEASATWAWTQNPFLQLLDYMTNPETGMGLPLARFLPVISTWSDAATACDEAVPLAAGGTVPRYQAGGVYLHNTAPADVIATILATADGWMAEDENGCFVVEAGKYYAPTVTLTDNHIINIQFQHFQVDEQSVNEIVVSYTDPTKLYTEVETDPWTNEADVLESGVIRSQRLSLPWVQNNSQARRLGKIALAKAGAPLSGVIVTTLEGLKAWGKRRVRIQAPSEGSTMADVVVDTLPLTLNADLTVTIPWKICDPTAYDWDAATEEGAGAGGAVITPPEPVPVPVIESVDVLASSDSSTRLRIFLEETEGGLTYLTRWRAEGESVWTYDAEQISISSPPGSYFDTGFVAPQVIEVEVSLVSTGSIQSDWTATILVNATEGDFSGRLLFYVSAQSSLTTTVGMT